VPSVVHVVVSGAFAGVERHISDVAGETTNQGWEVSVIGGHPGRMRGALDQRVPWLPGATFPEALRSLRKAGACDVCHAHMTQAEAAALAARVLHRAPVIATRHFARVRGSSRPGRAISPWIARGLAGEIAVSQFVARSMEHPPTAVVPNGVLPSSALWQSESRTVLVLQRLEAEKDTLTALMGWRSSGLAEEGWTLRIVGDGSQRPLLQQWVDEEQVPRVVFADWTSEVSKEFAAAGMLLAPAPAEPFGLAVVEAMAAGVPVVAAASGGHLETIGLVGGPGLFPPSDPEALAAALHRLAFDPVRKEASRAGRVLAVEAFSIKESVRRLLDVYLRVLSPKNCSPNT
jgi:glycosyltransferase involved in cell wall biosynthesis